MHSFFLSLFRFMMKVLIRSVQNDLGNRDGCDLLPDVLLHLNDGSNIYRYPPYPSGRSKERDWGGGFIK